jgi:hypothetical protein
MTLYLKKYDHCYITNTPEFANKSKEWLNYTLNMVVGLSKRIIRNKTASTMLLVFFKDAGFVKLVDIFITGGGKGAGIAI